MKYIYFLITIFLLSGCCQTKDLFYIQHTKVTNDELPKDCEAKLIEEINTLWLRHGESQCHYYNVFAQSLAMNKKECILGMNVSLIKRLLGKPDKEGAGTIVYVLDKKCGKDMPLRTNDIFRMDIVFHYSTSNMTIHDITAVTKRLPQY